MKHHTLAIAIALSAIIGCNRTGTTTNADSSPVTSSPAPSSEKIEFVHPTSPDELITTLTAAFDRGDKEAIDRLTYWADATEQQKAATREWLADQAGTNRILSIDVLATTDEDVSLPSSLTYTLESSEVLNIKYGDDSGGVTISFPFGERDGKYYISARYSAAK